MTSNQLTLLLIEVILLSLVLVTITPFDWMEASYFYYRPDDLFWGSTKGLYLDKGFNVKFSYKPKNILCYQE